MLRGAMSRFAVAVASLAVVSCTGKTAEQPPAPKTAPTAQAKAAGQAEPKPATPSPTPTPAAVPTPAPAPAADPPDAPTTVDGQPLFAKPKIIAARDAGVVMGESGASPVALALTPPVGSTSTVPVTMDLRLAVSVAGQTVPATDIPTISLDAVMEVTALNPSSVIVDVKTANVKASGEGGTARVQKALDDAVKELSTATATVTLDRSGGATVLKKAGGDGPNSLKPSLDGFFDTLRPMFAPLPKQPVGVGGSWEVVTHQEDGGAAIQQVVRYEVTALTNDVVSLSWSVDRGTTAVGPTDAAGIEAHAAAGKGVVQFSLRTALPTSSAAEIVSRTHGRVQLGTNASPMMVHQQTKTRLGAG